MCGRVIMTLSEALIKEELEEIYQVQQLTIDDFLPRYNIAPGAKLLSIINDGKINRAGYLEWKFIPPWAKDENEGYKYTNARSETIEIKPTFKEAFRSKRCLVIVNGFFEWKRDGNKKTPYFFYRENYQTFALAGIWNSYTTKVTSENQNGKKTYGVSIITTEANNLMISVHNRMPAIIKSEDIGAWLSNNTSQAELKKYLIPISDDYLNCYQVNDYVNSSRNQGKKCIEEISELLVNK